MDNNNVAEMNDNINNNNNNTNNINNNNNTSDIVLSKASETVLDQPEQKELIKKLIPSPNEQYEIIKNLENKTSFNEGCKFTIINSNWFNKWKKYVNYKDDYSSSPCSPTTNTSTTSSPTLSTTSKDNINNKEEDDEEENNFPCPINNNNLIEKILNYNYLFKSTTNQSNDEQDLILNLLFSNIILRKDISEKKDFEILSEQSFLYLSEWYGYSSSNNKEEVNKEVKEDGNNQLIIRKVIIDGLEISNQIRRIEIHPFVLQIYLTNENGKVLKESKKEIQLSKKTLIKDLKLLCFLIFTNNSFEDKQLSKILKSCRCWSVLDNNAKQIIDNNITLEEARIIDNQQLIFEIRKDGTKEWPVDILMKSKQEDNEEENEEEDEDDDSTTNGGTSSVNNQSTTNKKKKKKRINEFAGELLDSFKDYSYNMFGIGSGSVGKSKRKGLCGLRNLGNTCFMNSALQCLSNTIPLRDYFYSGEYKEHINKVNPLGSKGKLAKEFAALIKEMWSGNGCFSPVNLKYTISQIAPQFGGYQQHDSQELIAYLLDGLHEDLNQVKTKPYVELKDSDGQRPDKVVAKESWKLHLMRNRSVIVDLFQGQLKSTLHCNVCGKISIKFDPFMYLSCPIGQTKLHKIDVIFMNTQGGNRPTKYSIQLPTNSNIQLLTEKFIKMTLQKKNLDKIYFVNMAGFSIDRILDKQESILEIDSKSKQTPKVLCFEAPDDFNNDINNYVIVNIRQRYLSGELESPFRSIGIPFILFVKKGTTTQEFYHLLFDHLQRIIKKDRNDPEANIQPIPNEGSDKTEYTQEEKLAILKESVFPTFNFETLPFKLSAIEMNEDVKQTSGHSIIYTDEKDTIWKYIHTNTNTAPNATVNDNNDNTTSEDNNQQQQQYTICVDWFDKSMLKTKEAMTVHVDDSNNNNNIKEKNYEITLDDCLRLFSETEQLGENDQWYCPQCKEHRRAFKKFEIWSSPNILIIHLKRFGYRNRYLREKVTNFVDFPIYNLDLSEYMVQKPEEPLLYDLYGISCHTGGLSGGHYYSYAKNSTDGKWYCFNDQSVSQLQENEIKTSNAYLLFYQRKKVQEHANHTIVPVEFE
ncbi:hypothetical protein ABK040_012997 [Willaertia magna]